MSSGKLAAPPFFGGLSGDFDAVLADWLDLTYDDHRREKIDTPEVRALFEAERSGDGYILEQPIRANDFRRLKRLG